jgi:hypothetical protein
MKNAEQFINQEVTETDRAFFPNAFKAAYAAVTDLVSQTPFLKCPPASLARGHLKAWAIDFAISQLIEAGKWKVEGYDWAWYNRKTGKYLRVFTKEAVITVNQIADKCKQPRSAEFRANGAYDPQETLFLLPNEKNFASIKRPLLLLIHGYHDLSFIHLAMPNPEKIPAWFGMSKNILTEVQDVSSGLAPAEGPSTVQIPTIKEQLRKKIKDHGF